MLYSKNFSLPLCHGLIKPVSDSCSKGVSLVSQVDQFYSNDFFYEDGVLQDIHLVAMKAESNPELAAKLKEAAFTKEVEMLPVDMSEDDMMKHFTSKYDNVSTFKNLIESRIHQLETEQSVSPKVPSSTELKKSDEQILDEV